ncbi:hypothetical protein CDAR_292471 [Caerostris darwini]|uniref:Uncharacterized protein n=1 Tax=Caerostris darwini TaxID=1538125 RepID=A0AAV4QFJ9_9ARAC|nr:hypothetical protein CDAR_292471 [Caerostris darwini]
MIEKKPTKGKPSEVDPSSSDSFETNQADGMPNARNFHTVICKQNLNEVDIHSPEDSTKDFSKEEKPFLEKHFIDKNALAPKQNVSGSSCARHTVKHRRSYPRNDSILKMDESKKELRKERRSNDVKDLLRMIHILGDPKGIGFVYQTLHKDNNIP